MENTVNNPSPVPLPESFVVKNGSKILCCTSLFMPQPVSETSSRKYLPGGIPANSAWCEGISARAVEMHSRPPFGIASFAFIARFRMI